jgi:hypothetical protein
MLLNTVIYEASGLCLLTVTIIWDFAPGQNPFNLATSRNQKGEDGSFYKISFQQIP